MRNINLCSEKGERQKLTWDGNFLRGTGGVLSGSRIGKLIAAGHWIETDSQDVIAWARGNLAPDVAAKVKYVYPRGDEELLPLRKQENGDG